MLRRKSASPTHNRPETNKQPTGRWWWDGLCANDATNFVNKSSRKSPSPLSLSSWCGSVSVFLPSSETCFFVRSYWMIFFSFVWRGDVLFALCRYILGIPIWLLILSSSGIYFNSRLCCVVIVFKAEEFRFGFFFSFEVGRIRWWIIKYLVHT